MTINRYFPGGRVRAAALAALALCGAPAMSTAAPTTDTSWMIVDGGFGLGGSGTLSGTFTVSATTGDITSWHIITSTDGPGQFQGFSYNPSDSKAVVDQSSPQGVLFELAQQAPAGEHLLPNDVHGLSILFDVPFAEALLDHADGSPNFIGGSSVPLTECTGIDCLSIATPTDSDVEARYGCTYFGCSSPGVARPVPPTAAVPEPAPWAIVMLGFGIVGSAIRDRRRPGLAACSTRPG